MGRVKPNISLYVSFLTQIAKTKPIDIKQKRSIFFEESILKKYGKTYCALLFADSCSRPAINNLMTG